jgi:hypothetical protein
MIARKRNPNSKSALEVKSQLIQLDDQTKACRSSQLRFFLGVPVLKVTAR